MPLQEQIKAVHVARMKASQVKALLDADRAQWEQQHAATIQAAKDATEGVAVAEATLREMALEAYNETGSKDPAPGIGIRVMNRLEYDPKDAYSWAISHEMALQLDKRTFEKIADATVLDFVEKKEETTATIATDLSKFVEGD